MVFILPRPQIVMEPHSVSVDEDLNNAAKQVEVYAYPLPLSEILSSILVCATSNVESCSNLNDYFIG